MRKSYINAIQEIFDALQLALTDDNADLTRATKQYDIFRPNHGKTNPFQLMADMCAERIGEIMVEKAASVKPGTVLLPPTKKNLDTIRQYNARRGSGMFSSSAATKTAALIKEQCSNPELPEQNRKEITKVRQAIFGR